MVIDNWKLPCKYHIGSLDNIIYLQSFDDKIDYQIDDAGEPICSGISGTLSSMTCQNVLLSEESSNDTNRYAFKYVLTAVFREGDDTLYSNVLKLLRENKYRLYVRTTEGMYYLVNAEYPYTLEYDYVWSNSSHHCTLTFTCNTNIPTMKCTVFPSSFVELIPRECGYFSPRIDDFQIIEQDNVRIAYNASELKYTQIQTIGANSWKNIAPLEDSFTYTHHYSDNGFTDAIQFDIELADYLTTFHYNILEFVKNRYVVRFKSSLGNTIIVGDDYGLQPSFSLATGDEYGNLNRITIVLRQSSGNDVRLSADNIVETVNTDKKHGGTSNNRQTVPTPTIRISGMTFPSIECISPTMAKRIIMPQMDANGDETGKYYVHEDYEQYFGAISDLIIGRYNDNTASSFDISLYVNTTLCQKEWGCLYTTTLNDRTYLLGSSSTIFGIISSCGWKIVDKDSCLSFDLISGSPGQQYVVTVTSSCNYGDQSEFTIKVGDDEYTYTIIKVDSNYCFVSDSERSIVASATTLEYEMNEEGSNVSVTHIMCNDNDTDLLRVRFNGNTMYVDVPEYTDFRGYMRYFRIILESSNGGYCDVLIMQDHPYQTYRVDKSKYQCIGTDKYYVYQRYTGYTLDNINTPTGEYTYDEDDAPWERNSPDCIEDELIKWFDADDVYYCEQEPDHPYEKWSASTEYLCDGTDKYEKQYKMVSDDGENWSATTDTRMGDLIAHNSSDCGYCPTQTEWRDDTASTICNGVALCYVAYQWESTDCGTNWTQTSFSGYGTVISEDTVDCGGSGCTVSGDSSVQFKWVDVLDEKICMSGNSYYVSEQYYSNDCGNNWEKTGYRGIGSISTSGASECGTYTEAMYKWEDSDENTICLSGDSYYLSYRYVSYDSGTTWIETGEARVGSLKERNASRCSDSSGDTSLMYKWELSNATMCYDGDLYYLAYRYASVDGGHTWSPTGAFRIDRLKEEDSSECDNSSGTTVVMYKWEESSANTVCLSGDSYYVSYRYVSYDSGTTWNPTGEESVGSLKESGSTECSDEVPSGGTMYKWVQSDTDTMCDGYSLYYIEYEYSSTDNGVTWVATGNQRKGALISTISPQCGSADEIYKWEDVNETTCFDGDLYYKCYRFVSHNGGVTWVQTPTWRVGTLIERNAADCTECPLEYKWIADPNDYMCDETTHTKYEKTYYYWSDDCWETKHLMDNIQPSRGDVIEYNSYDCGYTSQKWEFIDEYCYEDLPDDVIIDDDGYSARTIVEYDYECSGTTKITTATTKNQETYDSGTTWSTTSSTSSVTYEENSEDCLYTKWEYDDDYCYNDLPENTEIIEEDINT